MVRIVKKPRVHYGNRYGVKLTVPTEGIAEVSASRTEGMTGYFLALADNRDWGRFKEYVRMFAASCYMQGVTDAIEVETRRRIREENGTQA